MERNTKAEQEQVNQFIHAQGKPPSTPSEWKRIFRAVYGKDIPRALKNFIEPPY